MEIKTGACFPIVLLLCVILVLASCSSTMVGHYVGNLNFSERYTSYAVLELNKDKTFVLRSETTTVETSNASSFVTETHGRYKMNFNHLYIFSEKARDGEISYRLDEFKTYRVIFTNTNVPLDTYRISNIISPVDTVYGDFQVFQEVHKMKFKKSKSNNSFYLSNNEAVFSKKIKPKRVLLL
jgi:hypothetical protein